MLYGNSGGSDVYAATNVGVSDVSDYGDGRDLRVSFNRAADESNLYGYRIMVVKASDAPYFSLSDANNVSSSNYTSVGKTGYNITKTLASGARDVDGHSIRNGVNYRVFVLSVGSYGSNALSSYSASITLTGNSNVYPATNVSVNDVADHGDGRDLQVSFTRAADESNLSGYRIMAVKSSDANSFNLSKPTPFPVRTTRPSTRLDLTSREPSLREPGTWTDIPDPQRGQLPRIRAFGRIVRDKCAVFIFFGHHVGGERERLSGNERVR
ncbi:hypothetical protein VQ056_06370 [Paenibacillus sp. JTLBN-2024]